MFFIPISQYYCSYCIIDPINAETSFKKYKKNKNLSDPQILNSSVHFPTLHSSLDQVKFHYQCMQKICCKFTYFILQLLISNIYKPSIMLEEFPNVSIFDAASHSLFREQELQS